MKFVPIFLFLWAILGAKEADVVYLTWVSDPTTTMMVQWHTERGEPSREVSYRLEGDNQWQKIKGKIQEVQGTEVDVHLAHLERLKENCAYVFKTEGGDREYRFKTMPKELKEPVRMAIGGDAYHGNGLERFQRMNRVIAFGEPDFVVIGGDLAYTHGKRHFLKGRKWEMARWQVFLRELQKTVKTPDGRMIPLLPIVGNHDVKKIQAQSMFYDIFTFPEKGKAYRALDFGNYLQLVMLDTGHTWPIEGDQTAWLEKTLHKSEAKYQFAAYHVAAYPSYYPYQSSGPTKLRQYWVPLFEKYRLPYVFEHHNHTFKRTHPLKNGKVDPSGVTYLGDGCWGVPTRTVVLPKNAWYLLKSASINHCYIVTLTPDTCTIEARDSQNEVIDQIVKK